jgi:hypothetical protein
MTTPNPDKIFTQLTHYDRPNSMIDTVNGPLGYSLWCQKEAKRISELPGRFAYVCRDEDGKLIALWVNRVSGQNDTSKVDLTFSELKKFRIGSKR